jgi:hypothetical protein
MKVVDIISIGIGICGLAYAYYTNCQLTKGVKFGVLQLLRTLINRMEEEKKRCSDLNASSAMHHTQQDLDAQFKSLQKMFGISDKDAPNT